MENPVSKAIGINFSHFLDEFITAMTMIGLWQDKCECTCEACARLRIFYSEIELKYKAASEPRPSN